MMKEATTPSGWVKAIFCALIKGDPAEFSGVGLIFYDSKDSLPVLPLTDKETHLKLPTSNLEESIQLLSSISKHHSHFHDGFHLVEANTLSITDVSQFFSPPIPRAHRFHPPHVNVGARFMAALLGSCLREVRMTAILSSHGDGLIFEKGTSHSVCARKG